MNQFFFALKEAVMLEIEYALALREAGSDSLVNGGAVDERKAAEAAWERFEQRWNSGLE